ncbi:MULTISPECIES: LysM peptidoglycan-binding domain-containing protein [unclassified Frigoribacterium]|uniref:LysM peptidoglycan-binding domain-containing protein n=1 Tax=unclassified Frigoribacterium TaxID=2627005 RepID=UPI0007013307|nr:MULTISPECIES: LysM peptidoglycan-binding domain-containing protein [unclassified Frigoribacterium]KQN43264.1 hypothetical protein ASE87_07200 [Frigoribacterium sp. Leaf44]MBD8539859.1 LysM peptidoglycan-binding domain-containing protein [Frigoribacterium sp. CFBP 8751]
MSVTSASAVASPVDSTRVVRTRLRITRRGRAVVAALVAVPLVVVAGALVLNGGGAVASDTTGVTEFQHVTVDGGETLWQVASEIDPDADPRDVIADLVSLNNLPSAEVSAGQSLAVPAQYAR